MTQVTPTPTPTPGPEPGATTSEYQLTGLGAAFVAVAEAGLGVASAFGAPLTVAEIAATQGFVVAVVALVGSYALSRGIRKQGQ